MNQIETDLTPAGGRTAHRASAAQLRYLRLGLEQAGGKLPLFDRNGQQINPRTIRACMDAGWCEPWYANPIKPDWIVCRLTEPGRRLAQGGDGA